MSWLTKAQEKKAKRPPLQMWYGVPGCGKTSLASCFPKAIIIHGPGETGVLDLISAGQVGEDFPTVQVSSWTELIEVTQGLGTEDHPYKWAFFDTASEMQRLLFEHVLATEFHGNAGTGKGGFQSFAAGPQACVPHWEKWLTLMEPMRDKGVSPVILAHAKVVTCNDPEREAYDQWRPDLYETKNISLLSPTIKMVSELGFINYETFIAESSEDRKVRGGARAAGGSSRNIHFQRSAAYEAKSKRLGTVSLGDSPEEGCKNMLAAWKQSKEKV